MKVVATYSIKGGVGKTTTAINLSYEAARSGSRVLLWDLDPQGAATFFLRVKPNLKGGARRLVGSKGEIDSHVRATDTPGLDVLPGRLLTAPPRPPPRCRVDPRPAPGPPARTGSPTATTWPCSTARRA